MHSFTEIKRIRKKFGFQDLSPSSPQHPKLLDLQLRSFNEFIHETTHDGETRPSGIDTVLKDFFPFTSHSDETEIEFISSELKPPSFSARESIMRNVSYFSQLMIKVRILHYYANTKTKTENNEKRIKQVSEHEIYLADIPIMTKFGTFIINGVEKVLVSQLHRSPGVFFFDDDGKSHSSGKLLFSARIIPSRGSWLDFEFDAKDHLYLRIDRKRKIPATILLHSFGLGTEKILSTFYDFLSIKTDKPGSYFIEFSRDKFMKFLDITMPFDINLNRMVIARKGKKMTKENIDELVKSKIKLISIPEEWLLGKRISKPLFDISTGEIIFEANQVVTTDMLKKITENGINSFEILFTNEIDRGAYISQTLDIDDTTNQNEALRKLYELIRPDEPITNEILNELLNSLFFSPIKYNLTDVGRVKLNSRLGIKNSDNPNTLTKEDIILTIKKLIDIRDGRDAVDDIDNLGNRRIRTPGEMVEGLFWVGLTRLDKSIKEKLTQYENGEIKYQDIINSKPVTYALKEFFNRSSLCQFMDQINPLSEITHKRRISALGPGGLTRDRAGFEVRDVHPTHYGRICPIETPEGPNIGLINSLAMFAKIDRHGFLITPFYKIQKGVVTDTIEYLNAIEEGKYIIAQANSQTTNNKLKDGLVTCRHQNEFHLLPSSMVEYIDISPSQIVSVAAALIPFLEHDDANRALMGSNMQRQAVPLLRAEKPLVGTGMERSVAIDSGATVVALRPGVVDSVDSSRIVVKVGEKELKQSTQPGVDIYNLVKYTRSNQNMCINQKPIVKIGEEVNAGDVLADGQCTDLGELSLGQNMLVAFMPWHGYNFEDSILISEKVVKEERFTSIHIEELECLARDTKLGVEEITPDIPNVSEHLLNKLDESGIIYIGSEVNPNDILVGMATPRGEVQLSPEEKLLRAVFAEKASDVKDSSLRAPQGMEGVVVDVKVFTREGIEKDARALSIEKEEIQSLKKNIDDELRILKDDIYKRVKKSILNKTAASIVDSKGKTRKNVVISEELLKEIKPDVWFSFRFGDNELHSKLDNYSKKIDDLNIKFAKIYEEMKANITKGDNLPPNVLKMVKIFIAVKRRLQTGDKMAGRHGNKGVISRVAPVEDMPYLADGTPVDIVLNPLGVPSRMNIGQVLETHLGWATKKLGQMLSKIVKESNDAKKRKEFLNAIYAGSQSSMEQIESLDKSMLEVLYKNVEDGIPVSTPVFNGASESDIKSFLKLAELPLSGKAQLFDGLTGDPFDNLVTIGYMYMLKLNHLVDEKMHARSTGPYSLVSQQPLGGKAQFGGQRFGEMEVWALQAYGAAYTLHELLTYKSDDISGRNKVYKSIVDGSQQFAAGVPESFNVLIREIRSITLDLKIKELD